jgi:hypothetical protein
MRFNKNFKNITKGFYVLLFDSFEKKEEKKVYIDADPTIHSEYVISFPCIVPNNRDNPAYLDLFWYQWTNYRFGRNVIGWRKMTPAEEADFRKQLFRFERKKSMSPYEKAIAWGVIEVFLTAAKRSTAKQDFIATFDNVSKVLEELRKIGKEQEK